MQVRKITAAASMVVAGMMASHSMAASQTWVGTTDALWATGTNWSGGAAPGNINPAAGGLGADVATFNSALVGGTRGGSTDPIINENLRQLRSILFDTANVGAYQIGTVGGNTLWLGHSGNVTMNAAVTSSQVIAAPVQIRLPSSTNGTYALINNATSSSATLSFLSTISNGSANTRPLTFTLDGSNTGNNTVPGFTDNANANGAIQIIKTGAGTWNISGASTITQKTSAGNPARVEVNNGILAIQNSAAFGSITAANTLVTGTGTLRLDNVTLASNGLNLNGSGRVVTNGATALTSIAVNTAATEVGLGTTSASDVFTASGITGGTAATTNMHVTGPGTVSLTAANTYVGNWSFDGGTTLLGAATATALGSNPGANFAGGTLALNDNATSLKYLSGTSGTLTNNGTTATTVTVNQATDTSFAGNITDGSGGSIAITKSGVGALNLGGTNTYTGSTSINAGTIRVNGSVSNSAITVNNLATIGGNGTIGNVTVASGGKVTPGSAQSNVGTLNIGSLNLNSGSLGEFEFGTGVNDILNVTSASGLTLGGTALSLFIDGTTNAFATVGTYTLFDYNTAFSGSLANLSIANPQSGFLYNFIDDTTSTQIKLQITASGVVAQWNLATGGTWGLNTNWTPTSVPNGNGDSANFLNAIGASTANVTLDGNKTVGAIVFNNTMGGTYVIDQGTSGTLSFNSGTGAGAGITNQSGNNSITAPVAIADAGGLSINTFPSTSLTISGAISGNNLVKSGTGTLVLTNGTNSYGSTTVNGGTVEFSSGAIGGAGSALTLNGGTLRYATGNTQDVSSKTVTLGGSGGTIDTNGNNVTFANSIGNGGAGSFTKTGAGTLTVASSNNYTGATAINGGTLVISANDSLGVPSAGAGVSINGGTLRTTATMTLDNAGSNQRAITIGASGATISSDTSTTTTITGSLNGSGALTKNGAGSLDISSDNTATFTGPVTVAGGILRLQNGNAIAGSVLNYNNAGGTLAFGSAVTTATVRSIVGNQNISLTNDGAAGVTLNFGADNTAWAYSGSFSGLGSLVKQGSGLLTLTGSSTITGSFTLQNLGSSLTIPTGGSLTASSVNATAIGAGLITVSGGTLVANTAVSTFNVGGGGGPGSTGFLQTAGTSTFADVNIATDNNNANVPFVVNDGTVTVANLTTGRSGTSVTVEPIAGATNYGPYINGANAIFNVTGNLNLGQSANANSNSNMRVDAGTVTVTGITTIGHNNGGRWTALDVNGGTFTSNETSVGVTFGHPNGAGNSTFIVRGTGVANVPKFTLGNLATVSFGTIQVRAGGTLNLGSGGIVQNTLNSSGVIRLEQGLLTTAADFTPVLPINLAGAAGIQGTIQAADTSAVAKNVTVNVPVYGTGGFIKTGAGSMTINGMSSYTGPITNNAGTLTLNSPNHAAANVTLTDTLAGLNLVIVNDTTNLVVGQRLSGTGTGLPEGTYITSIVDGTTLTVSNNATATLTAGAVALTADGSGMAGLGTPVVTNNATLNLPVSGTIASLVGTGTTNVTSTSLNIASGRIQQNTLNTSAGTVVTVAANGTATGVSVVNNLNLNATSKLELHNNDLVVDYGANPTQYTNVVNKVKDGLLLLGGSGNGIASFEVDNQTVGGTMLAVVDDGDPLISGAITELSGLAIPNPTSSVLVKYTWFGDSNLDGIVDGSDYALIDTGFTAGGALGGWVFGDYDYSGTIDGSDYALIDTGFISQTGALPEPTTLGLLGLGAMGMLRRRRQA